MTTFRTEDDVLTLLIHLGYLSYDYENKTVKIPNNEVREEYVNSVSVSDWGEISKALKNSADTLQAIWQGRPEQVALGIQQAHFETSHIQYNDENALSYTVSLRYTGNLPAVRDLRIWYFFHGRSFRINQHLLSN